MTDTPDSAETLARKIAEAFVRNSSYRGNATAVEGCIALALPLIREHDRERVSAKVEAFTLVKQLRDDLRERDQELARLKGERDFFLKMMERVTRSQNVGIETVEAERDAARKSLDAAVGLLGDWCRADDQGIAARTRAFLASLAPAPVAQPEGTHEFVPCPDKRPKCGCHAFRHA